jgi:hypothetical protein
MGSREAQLPNNVSNVPQQNQCSIIEPVTLLAEPPLQADIMMSNSMMESLILELPD